ncbi:unannotated protein [freshwater metagenome]|uniref:Unannotated protein n=1 Tax=freshwater metagenome TaxID=449393 RepID=A0A6J7H033_9ZZZZ
MDYPIDRGEGGGGIASAERLNHLVKQGAVRETQQSNGPLIRDGRPFGASNQLIEQRQGVARGAPTGTNHEREHARVDGDAFESAHLFDVFEHGCRRNQPEGIVVRARADGANYLLGLGGGKDELDVLGRFFDQLEQRIEPLGRHHVRLIENEDLEAVARRGEGRTLTKVTGIVHTVVAGRIDLDNVEAARAVARELNARSALSARRIGGTLSAVEAASKDARRRGLATPARSTKQVGVVDAVGAQRRHQRVGDLRLPNHFGKRLGPVAAVESGGHFSIVEREPDKLADIRGPLAHPPEPGYPCYVSVLGELAWMAPREEPFLV